MSSRTRNLYTYDLGLLTHFPILENSITAHRKVAGHGDTHVTKTIAGSDNNT